ncbi:hypothetical protein H5410_020903 [Solanum commersonii]|uniref:Uncharacterized protein n=1 Tax=Solanum commersonii TaxID=4109 RepID=A0A9J5ZFL4_SOLCO|nr:hypothetical protein H5410_020903 [Solanum commersonii]
MNTFINNNKFNKKKMVFIMGAAGMGKSPLSVNLTTHFWMRNNQLGQNASEKLSKILTSRLKIFTQRVPIIVGGSNSYIEKLVEDPMFMCKYKYDT